MRHVIAGAVGLALCAVAAGLSPARAAEEAPALELARCTIELVDGRTVEGRLAVQFDMDDYLIVYSPRLATVRSLLKKHVHALTLDGERKQLNAKGPLSEKDKDLLGRVTWPDAPPAEGHKPPYTTETWTPPKRLLVWARPGKSGRFEAPRNWLANGTAMTDWPRPVGEHYGLIFFEKDAVDLLFPASGEGYTVRPRGTSARVRHVTVEAGADAEVKLNNGTGNIRVGPAADFDGGGGAMLGGGKHTFFVHGLPTATDAPTTPETFRALMNSASSFGRKWVVRKDRPDASITLIGSFGSGDETHWMRGVTVLEENSVIAVGPRCTQTVGRDATLIMKSGSVLGKRSGNQCYKNDMRIEGELLAGTPDEPLTRDCYLGISIKDPRGRLDPERAKRHPSRGLTVVPGGRISVHTEDPARSRLHVTWHGILGKRGGDDGTPEGYFDKLPEPDRTINVNVFGEQVFQDVVFDWVGRGDIRLLHPEVCRKWKRVTFGGHTRAEGDAVFAAFEPDKRMQEQLARWRDATHEAKWARDDYGKGARYPRILPSGGTFAAGETVRVRLDALGNPPMRYTVDGSDSEKGNPYTGPFTLTESTTVRAGCFHSPRPHFRRIWGHVEDTFTFVDGSQKPDAPGGTRPGLRLRIYEHSEFDKIIEDPGDPQVAQNVRRFELKVPDGRMKKVEGYVYTGYLAVGEAGLYRFYTETEAPSRLYIGERLVVDNHRRYRYDWKPSGNPPLESWGSLRLEPGRHRIRVEYTRGRPFHGHWPPWEPQENEPFTVSYEGPGIEKQPIPAHVLSH